MLPQIYLSQPSSKHTIEMYKNLCVHQRAEAQSPQSSLWNQKSLASIRDNLVQRSEFNDWSGSSKKER